MEQERKIGEVFEYNGEKIIVKKDSDFIYTSRTASHSKRTAIMFQPHFCLLIISFLIWKTYISYLRARLPKAEVPPTYNHTYPGAQTLLLLYPHPV